ncbi:MAG TPA: hypothetical protein VLK27_11035 [Chthoniobacterales bacterium]|nr:hypothetical protein [Chthoniobacterales bacterium]
MKTEMRRALASQTFEEKIAKVGELIQLSRKVKAQRVSETTERYPVSGFQDSRSTKSPPKKSKR